MFGKEITFSFDGILLSEASGLQATHLPSLSRLGQTLATCSKASLALVGGHCPLSSGVILPFRETNSSHFQFGLTLQKAPSYLWARLYQGTSQTHRMGLPFKQGKCIREDKPSGTSNCDTRHTVTSCLVSRSKQQGFLKVCVDKWKFSVVPSTQAIPSALPFSM